MKRRIALLVVVVFLVFGSWTLEQDPSPVPTAQSTKSITTVDEVTYAGIGNEGTNFVSSQDTTPFEAPPYDAPKFFAALRECLDRTKKAQKNMEGCGDVENWLVSEMRQARISGANELEIRQLIDETFGLAFDGKFLSKDLEQAAKDKKLYDLLEKSVGEIYLGK